MKDTKKFGLLIVDDKKDQRALYKNWLTDPKEGHDILRDIWESVKECDDGIAAFKYIQEYKKIATHHLIVISDAYMPPNSDGNIVRDKNKLFGGLWLINEVTSKNIDDVTILLVSFFDRQIKEYIRGDNKLFTGIENKHYYFAPKPVSESTIGNTSDEEISKKWAKQQALEKESLYKNTFDVLNKIIQVRQNKISNENSTCSEMIGNSYKIQDVLKTINQVAQVDETVLISGESGTGKELVAEAIHNSSKRKNQPFVAFNCAAIPEGLLESELFGYERGAFTGAYTTMKRGRFELANRGSIFLDEIGDLPLSLQPKILRVLEESKFKRVGGTETIKIDVRFIAATHKNLEDMAKSGGFRADLYYRLNVLPIVLPPLRERREDIRLLATHFLDVFCKKYNKKISLDQNGMDTLEMYNWPGNIRELKNIMARIVVLARTNIIKKEDVEKRMQISTQAESKVAFSGSPTLKDVEKELLMYTLRQSRGVKANAAYMMNVSPSTIANMMRRYKITDNFGDE